MKDSTKDNLCTKLCDLFIYGERPDPRTSALPGLSKKSQNGFLIRREVKHQTVCQTMDWPETVKTRCAELESDDKSDLRSRESEALAECTLLTRTLVSLVSGVCLGSGKGRNKVSSRQVCRSLG